MQESTIQILNLVFSGVTAAGSLVAAAAAVTAIVHFWQHRRDDDVRLAVLVHDTCLQGKGKAGGEFFTAGVSVVNVGKPTVTIAGVRISGTGLSDGDLHISAHRHLMDEIDQGAVCEFIAVVTAADDKIAFPDRAFISCVTASGEVKGRGEIDFAQARAACEVDNPGPRI